MRAKHGLSPLALGRHCRRNPVVTMMANGATRKPRPRPRVDNVMVKTLTRACAERAGNPAEVTTGRPENPLKNSPE